MRKTYILSMLVSAVLASACSTSLLDIPQQGAQTEDNSYISDADCEAAVAAVYASWRTAYSGQGKSSVNGFFLKNLLSDEILGGGSGSNVAVAELSEIAPTPTNAAIDEYYQNLYKTIYLANLVIHNFKESESAVKKRDIAEAKFFRAMCYYELVTLWGPVPKVDHVLAQTEYQITNTPEESLWAFIEKDLNEAVGSGELSVKKGLSDPDANARVTEGAAYSLLGKVFLYQGKYSQAKTALENVVNSHKYGLIDDYGELYHIGANGCPEYVFECVRLFDPDNAASQDGWDAITAFWPMYSANLLMLGPDAMTHYQFPTLGYGWSAYHATKSLYDTFVAAGDTYRRKNTVVSWDEVVAMNLFTQRRMTFVECEGYLRKKWLWRADDAIPVVATGTAPMLINTPVIRYADVLLMLAEACVQTGASGDEYYNQVRTRAHMPTKSGVTLDDIKLERQLELSCEAVRFQDLKRWDDAKTVLANKGKVLSTFVVDPNPTNVYTTAEGVYNAQYNTSVVTSGSNFQTAGYQDIDKYLPFPQVEIETNLALIQNKGF